MAVASKVLYVTRVTKHMIEPHLDVWQVVFCVTGLPNAEIAITNAIIHVRDTYPTKTFVNKELPINYAVGDTQRGAIGDGYGAVVHVTAIYKVTDCELDKCSAAAKFGIDITRDAVDQASYGGGNESTKWYQTPYKLSDTTDDNFDSDNRPNGDANRSGANSLPTPYQLTFGSFGISIPTILSEVAAENTNAVDAYTGMLNMSKLVGTINAATTTSFQPTYSPGGWADKKIRLDPFQAAYLGNGYWGVRWNATASPIRWQHQLWIDVDDTEDIFSIVDNYPLDTSIVGAGRNLSDALPKHVVLASKDACANP